MQTKTISIEKKNANNKSEITKFKMTKRERKDCFWGYIMVAPTIIGLIVLNFIPLIQTFIMSFKKTGDFGKSTWAGLANYKKLLSDPIIWQATGNTFKFSLIVVPTTIILSLIVAVLLNQKIKGKTIYRTIYFLPMVAAPAAVSMVWKWLYNADFGLFNQILNSLGIKGVNWITDPKIALFSIAIVAIWSNVGYNMIIFLAALQEIPHDYYEAADVDGAGKIRQFFNITMPLVSPTIFFVMITTVISSIQVFDIILMMIGNTNPAIESTRSLIYVFYQQSFVVNDKGYGSAVAIFVLAIIMIITAFQLKAQKKWVHY